MRASGINDRDGRSLIAPVFLFGIGLALFVLIAFAPSASAGGVGATLAGGQLTVTGTVGNDVIIVRAVNASTIEVASVGGGERFAASSVRRIRVLAGGGQDTVSIVDARLAFTVTRPTVLDGGAGNDILLGGKGRETLLGGTGNDTVTGAGANDTVDLGAGTDTAVWKPGAGIDVVEGGTGADLQRALGTAGGDAFVLAKNGTRVRVGAAGGAARTRTVESVEVAAAGGADTIQAGPLDGLGLTALTLDGAGGSDTVNFTGTMGADSVTVAAAAPGTNTVTGTTGAVAAAVVDAEALHVNGGAGADTLNLPPLAALPVTFDGGADPDTLTVSGTPGADTWVFAAAGAQLQLDVGGSVPIVATTVETLTAIPAAGTDTITVPNLTTGGLTTVDVDLGVLAAGDTSADTVFVQASDSADVITAAAVGSTVQVFGNGPVVQLFQPEAANDTLQLELGDGDDSAIGGSLSALVRLVVEGGDGDDTVNGGNGADLLRGGAGDDKIDGNQGNDLAFLDAGDDTMVWDPGDASDIVEGGSDDDVLRFNGSAGSEVFAASANGNRLMFTRNLGNITMDVGDVEALELNALGGADTITVNSLAATDVDLVRVDLGVAATGDLAIDAVNVNGTAGEDLFQVTLLSGDLAVRTAGVDVVVDNPEVLLDSLIINAAASNDVIVAGSGTNVLTFTFNGGDHNDLLSGSSGNDEINGDDGDDTIFGNDGNDTIDGGAGTDFIDGGSGLDMAINGENVFNVP